MLDMGFFEVSLIAIVAVLVLGPKRLPKVARMVGSLLGKGRVLWRHVKKEVSDLDAESNPSRKRDSDE